MIDVKELKPRGSLAWHPYPLWADIKFDGEYVWLMNDENGSGIITVNPSGKIRIPKQDLAIPDNTILIGELIYQRGFKGDFYQTPKDTFQPFDILRYDGLDLQPCTLLERKTFIQRNVDPTITGKIVYSEKELKDYYNRVVTLGYEGLVVKPLTQPLIFGKNDWVKMKDKDTSLFPVSYIDPVRERIEVKVNDRHIGCKVMNSIKRTLKIGDEVAIEHYGILQTGGLRHPVFKGKKEAKDGKELNQ